MIVFKMITMRNIVVHKLLLGVVLLILAQQISAQTPVKPKSKFNFSISTNDITVIKDTTEIFGINLIGAIDTNVSLSFIKQHEGLITIYPNEWEFSPELPTYKNFCLLGVSPGNVNVRAELSPNILDVSHLFLRITVAMSYPLIIISIVVGWIYFLAWSVSFYPQIYINFKRKSVVGLNFDFLALNIVGFALYGIFNMGLFWSPYMEAEYFERHPMGLNPVLINDVVFALHAVVATLVTIVQCFMYERGEQRVSTIARSILGVFALLVILFAILAATDVFHWLDFLYACSYIKLTITLIKYIPQAVMNYRRKSTLGWSIGNILLDFTGGMLSMLQMMLNAYNYDDWNSIFGDPTKFGLGLFSVMFDIFFMVQHYILYRGNQPYTELGGETLPSSVPEAVMVPGESET